MILIDSMLGEYIERQMTVTEDGGRRTEDSDGGRRTVTDSDGKTDDHVKRIRRLPIGFAAPSATDVKHRTVTSTSHEVPPERSRCRTGRAADTP